MIFEADFFRYFVRMSFNGRPFHGWQIQDNANSVQGELNAALKTLLKTDVETTGCGRTDTGVHAKMFYAHFDFTEINDLKEMIFRLNSILPETIAIHSINVVELSSHARFSATSRSYEYHIHQMKNPFVTEFSWYHSTIPSLEKLNAYEVILKENTDFSCFSKSNTQTFTNNCKITECYWSEPVPSQFVFKITADRFLRNMVRAIVGTLIKAAELEMSESDFKRILESKDRSKAGFSVPAQGLSLVEVKYPFNIEAF